MLGGSRWGAPAGHLHLGCVCPGEPAPPRLLLSASFGDLRGQPQERETERRTPGMITAKGGPEAMLTHLGEKEGEDYVKMRREESIPVCYICTKMPTEEGKEIRKA